MFDRLLLPSLKMHHPAFETHTHTHTHTGVLPVKFEGHSSGTENKSMTRKRTDQKDMLRGSFKEGSSARHSNTHGLKVPQRARLDWTSSLLAFFL